MTEVRLDSFLGQGITRRKHRAWESCGGRSLRKGLSRTSAPVSTLPPLPCPLVTPHSPLQCSLHLHFLCPLPSAPPSLSVTPYLCLSLLSPTTPRPSAAGLLLHWTHGWGCTGLPGPSLLSFPSGPGKIPFPLVQQTHGWMFLKETHWEAKGKQTQTRQPTT